MKLYNSIGPNPQVVRTFMAERGIELPTEDVDIMTGVNRQSDYLAINPAGQLPALQLDDGSVVAAPRPRPDPRSGRTTPGCWPDRIRSDPAGCDP